MNPSFLKKKSGKNWQEALETVTLIYLGIEQCKEGRNIRRSKRDRQFTLLASEDFN